MPRGKSIAGLRAERREFLFIGLRINGLDPEGRERYGRWFKTSCVDCERYFDTPGGASEGQDKKEFAYRLNWRCEECRGPPISPSAKLKRFREAPKPERNTERQNIQRRIHACRDLV